MNKTGTCNDLQVSVFICTKKETGIKCSKQLLWDLVTPAEAMMR